MDEQSPHPGSTDKRQYPRVPATTRIRWRPVDVSEETQDYLAGLAENYSFGGMFLVTDEPLKKGNLIEIAFSLPSGPPVTARALVQWVRRFRRPSGAGLKFVEFNGIGDRDFRALIESLFSG